MSSRATVAAGWGPSSPSPQSGLRPTWATAASASATESGTIRPGSSTKGLATDERIFHPSG